MDTETQEKVKLQEELCKEIKAPFFAPHKDRAWCCGRNIWTAITKEQARTELITGCPHCNRTFCD